MKFNLMKKDFLLTKRKFISYLIFCLGFVLAVKLTVHYELIEDILIAALGGLFSYFITIIEFEAEGKYKAQATILTFPYTRREIVSAKYICVVVGSLLYYVLCIVEMGILTGINLGAFSMKGIWYGVAISMLIHGVMIPFFMKYDYVKAASVMMLGIMAGSALFVIFTRNIVTIMSVYETITVLDKKMIMIAGIIVILISYIVSVAIFEKKELL